MEEENLEITFCIVLVSLKWSLDLIRWLVFHHVSI